MVIISLNTLYIFIYPLWWRFVFNWSKLFCVKKSYLALLSSFKINLLTGANFISTFKQNGIKLFCSFSVTFSSVLDSTMLSSTTFFWKKLANAAAAFLCFCSASSFSNSFFFLSSSFSSSFFRLSSSFSLLSSFFNSISERRFFSRSSFSSLFCLSLSSFSLRRCSSFCSFSFFLRSSFSSFCFRRSSFSSCFNLFCSWRALSFSSFFFADSCCLCN